MGRAPAMSRPIEPEGRPKSNSGAHKTVVRGSRAVLGFDGTAASLDALAYAIGWAHRLHAHLDVLYVSGGRWQRVSDACAALCSVALPASLVDVSGLVGSAVADLLAGTELTWSYHTAGGDVARALEARADSIGADAIIVGRSHRCRRHLRPTSTADRLLSCTRRIVIVVP